MTIRTVAGVVAILVTATCAQAETIRYEFNQAFWGKNNANADPATWQAAREAEVAANPSGYRYMTGGFDFETLLGVPSNFGLTVDFGPVSHTFSLNNPASDVFVAKTRGVDFQIMTFGYQITDSFGDPLTFGADTDERYKATLDIDFVYYKNTRELAVSATTLLREFESRTVFDYCFVDFGVSAICNQRTVGLYGQPSQLQFDRYGQGESIPGGAQTGGGNGTTDPGVSVVPLPATGVLLASVLGLGAVVGRVRKAG